MRKVLVITYYWPPMGGGGVQRWLKFTKYMRLYGWEPVVYTPENAELMSRDESLYGDIAPGIEVVKTRIWEPFELYRRFSGKGADEKIQPGFLQESNTSPFMQNLAVWIRGNFFIPDAKMFWIRPSVKFLKKYLVSNGIDMIISTGPPHSNHLIALKLKEALNIGWLADFRDPWTNIDYYHKLRLGKLADKRHHDLERRVVSMADEVVTVSWTWAEDFKKSAGRLPVVITNGFDEEDFSEQVTHVKGKTMTITHIGSLNADRCPHAFFRAVSALVSEKRISQDELKLKFIGPTDVSVFNDLRQGGIESISEHIPHLSHKEVLTRIRTSELLLLPLNDTPNIGGVIPGKLYEYIASGRPILCVGNITGDCARILSESGAGETFDFNDEDGIKSYLLKKLSEFRSGDFSVGIKPAAKFSRKILAGEICSILDRIAAART